MRHIHTVVKAVKNMENPIFAKYKIFKNNK